jgi:hypothetical protein
MTWRWLVWEYSICDLTVETDRLVAIAGLAKSFNFGEDYVAGLSKENLPQICCDIVMISGGSGPKLTSRHRGLGARYHLLHLSMDRHSVISIQWRGLSSSV